MSYHAFSKRLTMARDTHVCVWCCWPILRGSYYVRERSVYDGSWQNHAWHEACLKVAEAMFDETGEEEFISGNEMPWHALYLVDANATDRAAA